MKAIDKLNLLIFLRCASSYALIVPFPCAELEFYFDTKCRSIRFRRFFSNLKLSRLSAF